MASRKRWQVCAPSLFCHLRARSARDHLGHGFRLRAHEMSGQVAGEERVGLCSCERFPRVLLMFGSRAVEGDESGGKGHLRVVATKLNGFFDEREAIEALCGIDRPLVDPLKLFQSFSEIAGIKGG